MNKTKLRKLFISDVDDTLIPMFINGKYNFEKIITDINKKHINEAINKGHEFVFATGRSFEKMINISNQLYDGTKTAYLIVDNGATIVKRINKDNYVVIHDQIISETNLIDFIDQIESLNIYLKKDKLVFIKNDYKNFNKQNHWVVEYVDSFKHFYKTKGVNKLFSVHFDKNDHHTRTKIQEIAEKNGLMSFTKESRDFVEIFPYGTDKLNAIKIIMKLLNYSEDQTYFFGNGSNDINAVKELKNTYAVKNSIEELQKYSSEVINSCIDNGVGEKIYEIISKSK